MEFNRLGNVNLIDNYKHDKVLGILYNIGFILLLISFILPGSNILNFEIWKVIDLYIVAMTIILIYRRQNLNEVKNVFKKLGYLLFPSKKRLNKTDRIFLTFVYIFIYYIFADMIFSALNGNEFKMIFQQAYAMLSIMLKITFFLLYFQYNKENSNNKMPVIKVLYVFMVIKILFKLAFAIYGFKMMFGPENMVELYNNLFGAAIMSQPINLTGFLRIDTANDVLPFYIFLFYLYDENINKFKKIVVSILMFLYVIIIYSRVFIAFYVCALILILIHKAIKFIRKKRFKVRLDKRFVVISIIIILLCIGGIFAIKDTKFFIQTKNLITERFKGDATEYSDDIRKVQEIALKEEIVKNPIMGKGIGGYAPQVIRSEINKYSYELEHLAFIMQFGIVGFIVLIVGSILMMFIVIFRLINNKNNYLLIPIILATIFQVGKMMTNPFFDKITVLFMVVLAFIINCKNLKRHY